MLKKILLGLVAVFVLIQFIPYGHEHTNPVVMKEPLWDTPRTQELFKRACNDCHSNKSVWPWYSNVAPISWSIQHHVDEGREHFNVSMWGLQKKNKGDEAAKEVREGEMPLFSYTLGHPEARLSDAEKAELVKGLIATFGEDKEDEE